YMKNWEAMEAFVEVVRQGSFSAAAIQLGVSASHISRLISQLEAELNTTLLFRTTRRIRLSESGELYYQHCRGYLGESREVWDAWDTTALILAGSKHLPMLIDQGEADDFLVEQLKPEALESACAKMNYPITLRRQPGYDHSYYFIASFIDEHLEYHFKALS
ncbi:LysR family transcriptional regulator, partial [Marinomonas sp.]